MTTIRQSRYCKLSLFPVAWLTFFFSGMLRLRLVTVSSVAWRRADQQVVPSSEANSRQRLEWKALAALRDCRTDRGGKKMLFRHGVCTVLSSQLYSPLSTVHIWPWVIITLYILYKLYSSPFPMCMVLKSSHEWLIRRHLITGLNWLTEMLVALVLGLSPATTYFVPTTASTPTPGYRNLETHSVFFSNLRPGMQIYWK